MFRCIFIGHHHHLRIFFPMCIEQCLKCIGGATDKLNGMDHKVILSYKDANFFDLTGNVIFIQL